MNKEKYDIERYLSGQMTPEEQHAFEKRALSDRFLADALEGAEQITADQYAEDIRALNARIQQQESYPKPQAGLDPAEKSGRELITGNQASPVSMWKWSLRMAAGITLLIASTYFVLQLTDGDNKHSSIALQESQPLPTDYSATDTAEYSSSQSINQSAQTTASETKEQQLAVSSAPIVDAETSLPASIPGVTDDKIAREVTTGQAQDMAMAAPPPEQHARQRMETSYRKSLVSEEDNKSIRPAAGAVVASRQTIRGKVTAKEGGGALSGGNVLIKGTNLGTVTDVNGNYELRTDNDNPILIFSFIGMQREEVVVEGKAEVHVQLSSDLTQRSEVVVTGFGLTPSISTHTAAASLAHPEIGMDSFKRYLEEQVHYPREALEKKLEGHVVTEFYVETDGNLTGFTVVRSVGGGCDEELIRAIQTGPVWLPTLLDGSALRTRVQVAYYFVLP
jgi:TonB family protein